MPKSSKNSEKIENISTNNNNNDIQINQNYYSFFNYSIIYLLICLLFIYQLIVYIQNHSHLGGLTLWDTSFLIIVNADPRVPPLNWLFADCSREVYLSIYKL